MSKSEDFREGYPPKSSSSEGLREGFPGKKSSSEDVREGYPSKKSSSEDVREGYPNKGSSLGSLAQSARGKHLNQARWILIVIGGLTILVNGVQLGLARQSAAKRERRAQ
jgi:hypothetical protein